MSVFLRHILLRWPLTLAPCTEDFDDPLLSWDEPQNAACAALLAPLELLFYHCGKVAHENGYDCDVYLIPVDSLCDHLERLTLSPSDVREAVRVTLQKSLRRWRQNSTEMVRLTVPHRYQTFSTEQQVWGHESEVHPPALCKRARELTAGRCDACGCVHDANALIFRDDNPENHADENLGMSCPVCHFSHRLNTLGANDGVMVYLPELAAADVSLLLRAVILARTQGNTRQKEGATQILNWLTGHRKETEAFWGTSHPGEFGQALMQASLHIREDLQQRLRHMVLIVNPTLLNHPALTGPSPDTWSDSLKKYHSQN